MVVQTTTNSLLCLLLGLSIGSAQAEQAHASKTLADMISQAKRKQEQALYPSPEETAADKAKKTEQSLSPEEMQAAKTKAIPLLWSLSGSNSQIVAEVLYMEKVHVLRLHEGDREIGPWQIERYGPNGLYLVPKESVKEIRVTKDKKGKKAQKTKKDLPPSPTALFLPAPQTGTSLERFATALPTPAASSNNSMDGSLSQRMSNILPPSMATGMGGPSNTFPLSPPSAPAK